MKYRYEVVKNEHISDEKFESAFHCSITCIESNLYDYSVTVDAKVPDILIFTTNEEQMPFSLEECDEIIKGCFIDAHGKNYKEFKIINTTEI